MWQVRGMLRRSSLAFGESVHDLVHATQRNLVYGLLALYLIWHVVITVGWPVETGWRLWLVSVVVIGVMVLALWLLERSLWISQVVWQIGLALAITLAIFLFGRAELAVFYILLPLLSSLVVGWQAALLAEIALIGMVIWLGQQPAGLHLPPILGGVIVACGLLAALLGVIAVNAMLTVAHWALFALRQAQQNLEEARQHRAQLVQLYKDLDQTNYQLERANTALAIARETAERAERFKAEFVANVSHELRTPLNLIVGFTEMMVTSPESYNHVPLPGPYRSDLNAVYYSAQHLLALVDDVLDLARIEAGKIALVREEVELGPLLHEATSIVRDYIVAKGLELRVEVQEGLPALWIDRLRIRQTLLNLLVNAARYTKQGSIRVEAGRYGEEVVIRVTDTGQGIPEQEIPRLFQEFHSSDQPAPEWHTGTGLGLPISKKFVELHHGRMGVESIYGQGTSFWFTLPCPEQPAAIEAQATSTRYRPVVRLGESERITVVVHEDPRMASLLKRYLTGYQVIGTTDVEEGRQLAADLKALALVVDKADIVPAANDEFLTICCPLPSTQLVAYDLGAEELLVKPVSRHELLRAVDRLGRPIQRALVVDDDPQVVRLFRRMLRARIPSQECLQAFNGAEALELMRSAKPDLVLLDLVMPEVDGQSVLAQMADDPELAAIPVILVSARGHNDVKLHVSGAIQINKATGFEFGEVVRVLDRVLSALAPGWEQRDATHSEVPAGHPG